MLYLNFELFMLNNRDYNFFFWSLFKKKNLAIKLLLYIAFSCTKISSRTIPGSIYSYDLPHSSSCFKLKLLVPLPKSLKRYSRSLKSKTGKQKGIAYPYKQKQKKKNQLLLHHVCFITKKYFSPKMMQKKEDIIN